MTKRKKIMTRIVSLTMAVMLTAGVAWSSPIQGMEPFGMSVGGDWIFRPTPP